MTVLTDEAEAARLAQEAEDAAAEQAARDQLRAAALAALRAVLVRPDGTYLTPKDAGLAAVHDDLANGLVVVSDGTVALAVRRDRDQGDWRVFLVVQDSGEWTKASDRLHSLADLGDALEAQAG